MNNEDRYYSLYNVRNPGFVPLNLNVTVSESGFDAAHPWIHVMMAEYSTHNDFNSLDESRKDNYNNDTNMNDPKSDGEAKGKHDSAPTSPSHDHITPTVVRDVAITLSLYTTIYNTTNARASTPMTTIVNIPTHPTERLSEVTIKYAKAMNNEEKFYMLHDPRQPYPRRNLDLNKTVSQARFTNTNPWVQVSWTSNKNYAYKIPLPLENNSEDSSKSDTNPNDPNNDADVPGAGGYDSDSESSPHVCTLTIWGREGNPNLTFPVDPCETMRYVLELYCLTHAGHAPKTGTSLMIDSGTKMRPINPERSLIEHDIIVGVEHVVAVPASKHQEVRDHRAEFSVLLIHGKHGLPLWRLTNFSTRIPFGAAYERYE